MKICFIAPADNYHTKKWVNWFSERGHKVHVISFINAELPNAEVHFIDTGAGVNDSDSKKLKYLLKAREIKRLVDEIRPDIVNVHYATSYGTATALSGVRGYVLSVWGMDIYDFPKKTPAHKALLMLSLKRAGYIFSTSKAMAIEARKYTRKRITITPFGVDMTLFAPDKRTRPDNDGQFIIGTVKKLEDKYGISYLLRAAAEIKNTTDIPLRLRIAGNGAQEEEYHKLARELGIDDITDWLGFIPQEQAAVEWANMDVAVVPSVLESESFGVSAVEAEACETPVIISDIPGLMEATDPGNTSVVVKREDSHALAEAIIGLCNSPEKRKELGKNGRQFVRSKYELNSCFRKIEKKLKTLISEK